MFDGPPIEDGQKLAPLDQARIKGALGLLGTNQKAYAAERDHGYSRLSRMVNGNERVTPAYAESFNVLLDRARKASASA